MTKDNSSKPEENIHFLTAKFKSSEMEHQFRQYTLVEDKKRSLFLIMVFLISIPVFSYADYFIVGNSGQVLSLIGMRVFFGLVCFILLYVSLRTLKENRFDLLQLIFLLSIVASNIYAANLRPPGSASVAASEMIIILAFYLVLPTRIIYRMLPLIILSVFSPAARDNSFLLLHHTLSHLCGIFFAVVLNRNRRNQYLLLLHERNLTKQLKKSEEEVRFITERLAEQNKTLKSKATKDPLTGIHNRRAFLDFAEEQWSKAVRKKEDCSIILFDIDHFKQVNDTYGHLSGDMILKEIVRVIGKMNRAYDRFGRWGGEEFILYLPETTLEQARLIAERLREAVAESLFRVADGSEINITISMGVCSKTAYNTLELEGLIDCADEALYKAKSSGRNQVSIYHKNLK